MALESATYISELVDTNPVASDPVGQGDDHLKMIKTVLKTQFSGLSGTTAVTASEAELNLLDGLTSLTYTAGDGLDLTGQSFSTDLLSNGGLEIQSTELSVSQGISQYDVAQFAASVVDDDFLRVDGTAVEGRSASEVLSDIAALPLAGGAMTGAITTNSTFDGIDVATRDGVLTSTTNTANAALPKAGGTMTGTLAMADAAITRPEITDYSETKQGVAGAASVDLDMANGNVITITGDANTTFTFSNPSPTGKSCAFTLVWTQGSSNWTIAWPASVDWAGGSAPDVTDGAGNVDIYTFFTMDEGTIWYGFQAGADMG